MADGRIALTIDGVSFGGWKEVEVRRSIEMTAGDFTLTLTDRWPGQPQRRAILPGASCTVSIDGEPALVGYIDDVEVAYADADHRLTVSGRDRAGDLWDCAAAVDGPFEFSGLTLLEAARRLTAPFGIPVRAEIDVGRPFGRFSIQPGETAFEALERACRQRAVLPLADGLGGLILTRAGNAAAAGALQRGGRTGNVISASGSFSHRDRYSLYVFKGQREGEGGSDVEGRAVDGRVRRYRPTVEVADSQGDIAGLTQRAEWTKRVAAGRSRRLVYTVADWRADGALWRPNAIVGVIDPFMDLDRDLLIVGVAYRLSEDGGSRTELELSLPDAFALIEEPEEAAEAAASEGLMSSDWRPGDPLPIAEVVE